MRRVKNQKVKQNQPEASTSAPKNVERDLKYYKNDRIELIQQVFSVLKPEELKAMAPRCMRNISINKMKELCAEELLGISSKRLCAVIDGAKTPSDTESSSSSSSRAKLETISLDSISSDEEILNEEKEVKRKYRHRRRKKAKKAKQKRKSSPKNSGKDRSKAKRTGASGLEVIDLQARVGAIRTQLQHEQNVINPTGAPAKKHVSDDEVEIKEEPAEVIEISSEDEKPKVVDLQREIVQSSKKSAESLGHEGQTGIKRTNDLIITIPQAKPKCKIKLNRNKSHITIQNPADASSIERTGQEINRESNPKTPDKANKSQDKPVITQKKSEPTQNVAVKEKQNKKEKGKQKKKGKEKQKKKANQVTKKDGSDHDEITLKLSDSEKMDLLEDLDRKNFDNVSSESVEDSHSSPSNKSDNDSVKTLILSEIDVVETKKCDEEDHISTINENAEELDANSQALGDGAQDQNSSTSKDMPIKIMTVEDIPIRNESALQEVFNDQENGSNTKIVSIASTEHSNITKNYNAGDESKGMDAENPDLTEKYNTDREGEEGVSAP